MGTCFGGQVGIWGDGPACGVETEAARASGYDGDFALEGEDGGEVLELDLFCGSHFALMYRVEWGVGKEEVGAAVSYL